MLHRLTIPHEKFEVARFYFHYITRNVAVCQLMHQCTSFLVRPFTQTKYHACLLVNPELVILNAISILYGLVCHMRFFDVFNCDFSKLMNVHVQRHNWFQLSG